MTNGIHLDDGTLKKKYFVALSTRLKINFPIMFLQIPQVIFDSHFWVERGITPMNELKWLKAKFWVYFPQGFSLVKSLWRSRRSLDNPICFSEKSSKYSPLYGYLMQPSLQICSIDC